MRTVNDANVGFDRLWWLMKELPTYSIVTLTFRDGRVHELMAREVGRRYTNLTTGFEWFTDDSLKLVLENEIASYTITTGGKVR